VILNAIPAPNSYLSKLQNDKRLSRFNTTLTNPKEIKFLNEICNNNPKFENKLLCDTYYDMLLTLSENQYNATDFNVNTTLSTKLNKELCSEFEKKIPELSKYKETNSTIIDLSNRIKQGECERLCKGYTTEGNLEIIPICPLLVWGYALAENLKLSTPNPEHNISIASENVDHNLQNSLDPINKTKIDLKTDIEEGLNENKIINLAPKLDVFPNNTLDDKNNNVKSDIKKETVPVVSNAVNKSLSEHQVKNETHFVEKPVSQEKKPTTPLNAVSPNLPVLSEQGSLPANELLSIQSNPVVEENKDTQPKIQPTIPKENGVTDPGEDIIDADKDNDSINLEDENSLIDGFIPNKNDEPIDDSEDNGDDDSAEENTQSEALNLDKQISNLNHKEPNLPRIKSQDHSLEDPFFEENNSNFFSYFMFIMLVCIISYVIYHNKTKMLALMLEGRRGVANRTTNGGSRRKHTAAYRKLDSNLEEAITSSGTNSRSAQIIY